MKPLLLTAPLVAFACTAPVLAQTYPAKGPVHLVVDNRTGDKWRQRESKLRRP